jgi:alcohol dehydrogenase class IV
MSLAAPGFIYAAAPARVLFGQGRSHELCAELDHIGVSRVIVACTRSGEARYRTVIEALGGRCAGVFAEAQPHCPEAVANAALDVFTAARADGVVTIGGGSTIGLGKVIAARRRVPFVAIPTTLSGSEMTALYGMKIGAEKRTWIDPNAKAHSVIYDPDVTATLPKHETATTGMNCLAHCVEALYPAQPNPIARLLALDGIRTLHTSLPRVIESNDAESRAGALYGGFLGGLLVSMVGIGLHHKICHVLGGHFDLPHGETNSVILPHVIAFNAPAMPQVIGDIAGVLGTPDVVAEIFTLAERVGAPNSLQELGLARSDVDSVVVEIAAKAAANPRPVTADNIRVLLHDAWEGRPPSHSGTGTRSEAKTTRQSKRDLQGGNDVRSVPG